VLGLVAVGLLGACSGVLAPVPGEEVEDVGSQPVWCAGEGPAVVLVNGIGDDATSAQWLDVERALAADTRVCRYDRPGTGEAPAPEEPGRGADELDAELGAVVRHAAGDGPVVLVAHSFGGYLARVHAGRHPDVVAGLVFVDALDPSVGVVQGTGSAGIEDVGMAAEALDLADIEAAAASITQLAPDLPLAVLSRSEGVSAAWTAGQQRLATLVDGASSTVVDAGHQIPGEAPGAVVDAVRSVLGR
jgi:pimeloyl-ACP methyl ester carboxylesterase